MRVKFLFTKTVRRLAFAALTGAVTAFVGLMALPGAHADSAGCALSDVSAWQNRLVDETEEISPDYIRRETEAFLERCPRRPEIRAAHQIAGVAAFDMGDDTGAVGHFKQAGPIYSTRVKFYYASALLATRQIKQAWSLRNQLISDWLRRIELEPSARLEVRQRTDGTVYIVRFSRPTEVSAISMAWVAVPKTGGWPATLTIRKNSQVSAWRQIRRTQPQDPVLHMELYKCAGRTQLADVPVTVRADVVDRTVMTFLDGYLMKPDAGNPERQADIYHGCLWTDRMLPTP